ncbi:hypothetical protein [Sphingomonas sp. MM-1]|uniref:hypothetical protein n=1 Tax=Sphingomonas sp. MM-1 TaxID=745310 RepID=UPI0005A4417C|nr:MULTISPECIES: hypothetical protein [unclassified Sphingomonas]MDX3884046.1 hypothetical protein [Sphingomonas sp.]
MLADPLRRAAGSEFGYVPLVSADVAATIPAALAALKAGMAPSTEEQIEGLMGSIALLYPAAKVTEKEAEARLDLYIDLLQDIPFDILSAAFKSAAQTSRFFPTVAEIREAALPARRERLNKINGLKALALKHRLEGEQSRQAQAPMSAAEIEEANAIFQRLGIRTRYAADGTSYEIERGNTGDQEAKAA